MKTVDPKQLASSEASRSESTLFSKVLKGYAHSTLIRLSTVYIWILLHWTMDMFNRNCTVQYI